MNYWNVPGAPHKDWKNIGYTDLEEATHVCDMCGKEEIRYVHEMTHVAVKKSFFVGKVCAGKMTNDYNTPEEQLKTMKSKSTWMTRNWKKVDLFEYEEKRFNSKYGRVTVGIFNYNGKFRFHLDDIIVTDAYDTMKEAKEHIFSLFVAS